MSCMLCPRRCGGDRTEQNSETIGICGQTNQVRISRAALHMWEEPCISGKEGSGTVFFTGCPLGCIFCQNHSISSGQNGKIVSEEQLAEIYLDLQQQGANNINLVTAGHFLPQVAESLKMAKSQGLRLPIIYNTSGYETVAALRQLAGLVDVYLPDFKYMMQETAAAYAKAPDYPEIVKAAVAEMYRQVSIPVFEDGKIKKGLIVRHLLLPGHTKEALQILAYLHQTYGDHIYISIMNQYTPMPQVLSDPLLHRKVTKREYEKVISGALALGITQAFIQEGETAKESFIPEFTS